MTEFLEQAFTPVVLVYLVGTMLAGGLRLAIGPLVGGLITEQLDWSWIFFVNVPVGILGIAASFAVIDESRDETHERLDLPGLATSAVGLFALTYGLIEANTYSWTSPRIIGAFVIAGVALTAFVLLERHQRAPLLPLELFRNRTYTGDTPDDAARRARDVRCLLLRLPPRCSMSSATHPCRPGPLPCR